MLEVSSDLLRVVIVMVAANLVAQLEMRLKITRLQTDIRWLKDHHE